MHQLKVARNQEIRITDVFERNRKSIARYVVNEGGARSSKSYSIAQLLIEKLFREKNKKFLVTRKTFPALRLTAYKCIVDIIREYGLYERIRHNRTEHTITYGGNLMVFLSIDDPEKIKSTEWNYIWLEESNEFTWEDFIILQTRLSGHTGPGEQNQIFFSFNPTDESGWITQRLLQNPKYANKKILDRIHSTYKNNPFLGRDYIQILEGLKEQDPEYWRIFGLGQRGVLQNIIFKQYEISDIFPSEWDDAFYGLDFGFNNPTALIFIGEKDKNFWLQEKLYQTHLTNQDLIDKLCDLIPEEERQRPIYADNAEPDRIKEIFDAGFNIHPSNKNVKDGILFCKRKNFTVHSSSVNLIDERKTYKWKVDRNGKPFDEPVKFKDHLMDAKRYALYTHDKLQHSGANAMAV